MRVMLLCTDTGVRIPDQKGASLHLMAMSEALVTFGHTVLLVGVAGRGSPPAVDHILLPHPGRASGLRRELRKLAFVSAFADLVAEEVQRFRPEIVYERLSLFGNAGRAIACRAGVPHVVEANALLAEEDAKWRSLRLISLARRREQTVLARADLVVAVSKELARRITAISHRPVEVLPNGVDTRLFETLPDMPAARLEMGLPAHGPVIGFAGSLRPWHGVELAMEALANLPGVTLAIAGDGQMRTDLQALAEVLGVARRIRWLGHLQHSTMPTFLAAIDVALAPYPLLNDFAFSPLKVYEYLAAGVPVVASEIGQLGELVGPFGRLVAPGDPGAVASAVTATLGDPGARIRAASGRAWALRHHGWNQRARQLTGLIEQTVPGALVS